VLIDELWLFGKKPNAEGMLREATGGLASRPEGFVIYLTTQSDDPPAGVFRQKLDYARKVRDGKVIDSRFLPVIYEYPADVIEKKAYRDPSTFHIPNPNLGASVDKAFLEREYAKAIETGEHSLINFAAKHLNVEIGLALQSNRWAGAEYWERQERKEVTLEYLIDRADAISIGIDGGGLDDMLALVAIGRDYETRQWIVWGHAWVHKDALAKNRSEADRWRGFHEDGDLTITDDVCEDIEELLDYVARIDASNVLDKIGVDPAGIGAILDGLTRIGIDEKRVVGISQGWRLTSAIKTAERKLADGTMIHGFSPLFAWSVGNAKVEPKGNAILVTKQASGNSKIDLVMALFDATSIMSLNPAGSRSIYEDMAQERKAA
jgi:phage terminase large subunit-like protein